MNIYREITKERKAQDKQWGGPARDDFHTFMHWFKFIQYQYKKAIEEWIGDEKSSVQKPGPFVRQRFIKIAALAVAAVESIDRKAGRGKD